MPHVVLPIEALLTFHKYGRSTQENRRLSCPLFLSNIKPQSADRPDMLLVTLVTQYMDAT